MRRLFAIAATIVFAGSAGALATEVDYPNKPITMIVPFSAGGPADTNARVIAKATSTALGQPILVENRTGASGIVGTEYVARAKPDGYTLLYGSSGPMATNPHLFKSLSYDTLKSFTYVHGLAQSPMVLVVTADRPYRTFKEFVEYARANPGKLNYGTGGPGTAGHLAMELLQKEADIKLTQISYKGSSPAIADLAAGTLDAIFDYPNIVKPFVDAGKLRVLAASSDDRLKSEPTLPTIKELGYPGATFMGWATIALPAKAPTAVVERLSVAIEKALQDPQVTQYYDNNSAVVMPKRTLADLAKFVESENAKIGELIARSGAMPQ